MCARRRRRQKKQAPLIARSLPSGQYRFLTLVATATHRDSGVGAHAVGNACDALGCLGCDSVSCACYKFDPWHVSSLHLLYRVRGDQPRLKLHNATTVASIHHRHIAQMSDLSLAQTSDA
jgi:hypothetical protein